MAFNPAMSRSLEVQVSSSGTSGVINALGGVTLKIGSIPKVVAGASLALGALAVVALAGATTTASGRLFVAVSEKWHAGRRQWFRRGRPRG